MPLYTSQYWTLPGEEGTYAFKSADEQRDSDTLAADADLVLSLKGGQKYLVEAELWFWEPAADGSFQVTWTLPRPVPPAAHS